MCVCERESAGVREIDREREREREKKREREREIEREKERETQREIEVERKGFCVFVQSYQQKALN